MAIIKKVVGKVPIGRGEYDKEAVYYKENTVTTYGMSFRALDDISAGIAPAIVDITGNVKLTNTDKWQLISGMPDVWNITADVKEIKDNAQYADEEDITSDNNLLKLKDRLPFNGMGYVILRQNKSFKEQITKANTIYEIRYNFDLGLTIVDVPENCILKFEGGSLSNGRLRGDFDIVSRGVKIFNNIQFEGGCIYNEYDLDWFVSEKNSTLDLSGKQKDSSDEIQMACDSGVTVLKISNKHYYYVSKTILIYSWLAIIGDKRNNMESRVKKSPPCIYTDRDIIVLQVVAQAKKDEPNASSIRLEGFRIRRYGNTISQDNYHEDIPTLKIMTGNPDSKTNYAWGVYVDIDLYSADTSIPITKDGTTFNAYMNAYTGIEIYASDGGYLTYLQIKGTITGFRRAYYCHTDKGNKSWITDSRLDFDSNVVYGGDLLAGEPFRITGSHQLKANVFPDDADQYFFKVKGLGVSTAMIWDMGLGDKLKNVSKPYKCDYCFQDLLNTVSSERWEEDDSILPLNSLPIYRYKEYLYTLLNNGSNLLERIFNRIIGWLACDNVAEVESETLKNTIGKFNYARLYNDNEEFIDLSEDNVRNYDSLFKLSSLTRSSVGNLISILSDTFVYNIGAEYYKYEVNFTISRKVCHYLSKSYFVGLCDNKSYIKSIGLYNGDTLVSEKKFNESDAYYSNVICVPLTFPETSADLTVIIRGTLPNDSSTGRVIPKMGIITRDTSNVITSSGGEVVGRLVLSDVVLNDNHRGVERTYVRYLNNKYFFKAKEIGSKYWTRIVTLQRTYKYGIILEYVTYKGKVGCVSFSNDFIRSTDTDMSFKLDIDESVSTPVLSLSVKSVENDSITVTSIYCSCHIKFLEDMSGYTVTNTIENIHMGTAGSTRPTDVVVGSQFFDTSLGKPIYVKNINNGEVTWVDASGENV